MTKKAPIVLASERRKKKFVQRPRVKLIGTDGNAFALLGRCRAAAKKNGWTEEQWAEVQKEAMAGDYDHLLRILAERFEVR